MREQFVCRKGIVEVNGLTRIPGIDGVWVNPFGAGPNVVEIEHSRRDLAAVVKDATIGTIILEPKR